MDLGVFLVFLFGEVEERNLFRVAQRSVLLLGIMRVGVDFLANGSLSAWVSFYHAFAVSLSDVFGP